MFPKAFGCPAACSNQEGDSQHRNKAVHLPHQHPRAITPSQVSSVMPGVLSYPALLFPSLDCMQFLAIWLISTGSLPRDGNPELHNPRRWWLRRPRRIAHGCNVWGCVDSARSQGGLVPHSILRATSLPPVQHLGSKVAGPGVRPFKG